MKAPSFPTEATWLNVDQPIAWDDLRGHVVLLDFWTYCCVNCMHVLPVLGRLEERFKNEPFHVIGVHAAKFDEEKDPANIRAAIARHGIEHPVLVDSDHDLWQQYAIRAWPTLVLIDAEGKIVQTLPGEPNEADLGKRIADVLERDRFSDTLASEKRVFANADTGANSFLSYPGKVRVLPPREENDEPLLAISDTGHHRILLARVSFEKAGWPVIESYETVGGGGVGSQDGTYDAASFRRPQGVDRMGSVVYVADTENHLLRGIDLDTKRVTTLAGTGHSDPRPGADTPRELAVRSPWDCLALGDVILVSVAGAHQIWAYEPTRPAFFPLVGSGHENHVDGPFKEAQLAQPSSLAPLGHAVLFADSEVSSIRFADLEKMEVFTVMGRGLFDFGDKDGKLEDALLQHPLGAVFLHGAIYIADTFNNKIKRIDWDTKTIAPFFGDGSREMLFEPGGLDAVGDVLLVPDTNNNRIRMIHRETAEVRDLAFP